MEPPTHAASMAMAAGAGAEAALSGLPAGMGRVGPGNIRSLILEKEKELHDINEYRIRTLEALLRDKETAGSAAKQKLAKLQEDFKYNLKLLEGRDEELALYDANFASLKGVLREREAELSELRAREAELQTELQRQRQRAEEQATASQQQLKDARAQMESARWKFDDELRRQQDALETQRRAAERALREKDEDVETQRRELSVTFDDVMRQREAEFKRSIDALQTQTRELELQSKAAQREGDMQRARAEELQTKAENLQQLLQEGDKELKTLEWTLADVRTAKDARVGELEAEVRQLHELKQKLLDEYESKMAELLQSLHAVEKAFVQQKTQHDEELARVQQRQEKEVQQTRVANESKTEALQSKLRESQEEADALRAELKQAKWDADDAMLEKQRELERLQSAMQDLRDEQQRVEGEWQHQLRSGDRETQTLQEKLQDAARQLQLAREKEKALHQELASAAEVQEDLQRELVAANLRWENRWQEQQQELDDRHELRVRELQQVKDRLLTEKQAVEERLVHAENDVQRLRVELSSLKSSARITESFGSQVYVSATRSGSGARASSESAPAAPSPLWSDDPGSASPLLSGMSPLLSESPSRANNSSLETENAHLRDAIRQMKDALVQQAREAEGSSTHGGDTSSTKLMTQLQHAQERCTALEKQLENVQTMSGSSQDTALQLESYQRELAEAQRVIEVKNARVAELEALVAQLEGSRSAEPEMQSARVAMEAQLSDLKRKLGAANEDIDRLVRERSQLMELSNQLRADLRRAGSVERGGASASGSHADFAGKKDYENLVSELTQSLEDARTHNKTLKKELRRMVKLQVQQQRGGVGDGGNGVMASVSNAHTKTESPSGSMREDESGSSSRRRSSTLSMMRSLDATSRPSSSTTRSSQRSSATASTISGSEGAGERSSSSKTDLDEQLLALARNKRPSSRESRPSSRRGTMRALPPAIPERSTESEGESEAPNDNENAEADVEDDEEASARSRSARSGERSPMNRLFRSSETREAVGSTSTSASVGGPSAKVTDARLKLQQAKEMLLLSGKKAPTASARGSTASLANFAQVNAAGPTSTTTRTSDRETTSQRRKLKQLQTKRAEMVNERKKVRNYSLVS